jgi:hypothetical protein
MSATRTDAPSTTSCRVGTWAEDLWPSPDTVTFQPTTLEERETFARLVPALLREAERARPGARPPSALVADAARVGFLLEARAQGAETFWVLRELPALHRGAGAYAFRTGPATSDVVQAPHEYYDLGTGPLAAELFACAPEGRRPRAFATNTAHRYRGLPGEKEGEGEHPADVAHNPDHLFQVVTDALARTYPGVRVVQLHGFAEQKHPVRAGVTAVVSAGSGTPSRWSRQVLGRLSPVLGDGVRLYPEQTRWLGGTRNAQARLLQAYPRSRFLHLELSPRVRKDLTSRELMLRLADVLLAPSEEE